ncbi:hypothetical protein CTAYLR_003615 [Chrysophaeum taylorii]|uniref:Glycosyltransferase 61 catalytic domain-containing protein n=1 Tax=Chrysophaeum taylorii TaxID=2483200 RepID=A0AAD7XL57_9STRA|nr:hypothetical protein CTAYLR_003615 [Chrysophaeum taylorii]
MRRRGKGAGDLTRDEARSSKYPRVPRAAMWVALVLTIMMVLFGVTTSWVSRQATVTKSNEEEVELARLEGLVATQNATIGALRRALDRASSPSNKGLESRKEAVVPKMTTTTTESRPQEPERRSVAQNTDAVSSWFGHRILTLSDAAVRSTPMNELMASYGPTKGGGTCEKDFGNALVTRWRSARKTYCGPKHRKNATHIECFLIKQTSHHGNGDQLCLSRDVRINFRDLADGRTAATYFENYVASKHQQQHSKIRYSKGTWAGTCAPETSLWQAKFFPGWNVNWFNAFESVDALECEVFEEAPTLIVERDTFANLFHNSEDFFNAQIALAILEWSLEDVQILLTDIYPKGPFWPMWSKVFRGAREPLTAFDVAQKYGTKNVCFKKVVIAILGAAAPVTVASFNTRCSRSAIVRSYADLVVATLGLAEHTRYARANVVDPKRVVVTFMARRSASEWPEKRFCDSRRSFFRCERLNHLGVRKLGRSVKNDAAVVSALKTLEQQHFQNGARVEVQDVDYSILSYEDQIRTDLDTDVMVGPHGAGLLHNIFMPDRAVLVELFIDASQANRHFHNFARWQGRNYFSKSMTNPVPPDDLLRLVSQAINSLDLSRPH